MNDLLRTCLNIHAQCNTCTFLCAYLIYLPFDRLFSQKNGHPGYIAMLLQGNICIYQLIFAYIELMSSLTQHVPILLSSVKLNIYRLLGSINSLWKNLQWFSKSTKRNTNVYDSYIIFNTLIIYNYSGHYIHASPWNNWVHFNKNLLTNIQSEFQKFNIFQGSYLSDSKRFNALISFKVRILISVQIL